jgi:drug/metabolite transporter (DMT)-like permease
MNPKLFLALIPPFLYAASNYIDQYLVHKYDEGEETSGVVPLVMVSSLFSIIVLVIIGITNWSSIFTVSGINSIILIASGVLQICAITLYLYALEDEDSDSVAPFWLLVAPISLILSSLVLGESLNGTELISGGILLAGALIMNIHIHKGSKSFSLHWKIVLLMISAAAIAACINVAFKFGYDASFFVSLLWNHIGTFLFGICWYLFSPSARTGFKALMRESGSKLIGVNGLNESLVVIGDALMAFAVLWGPVAIGEVLYGTQVLWVFLLGLVLYRIYPAMFKERHTRATIIIKCIGLCVIAVGLVLLV